MLYQIPVAPFINECVLYVPLNAAAHIAGLNYTQNDVGTEIITPTDLSDNETVSAAPNDLYLSC